MKEISNLLSYKSGQVILNIGAGKEQPLDLPDKPYMLVNVDSGYYDSEHHVKINDVFSFHRFIINNPTATGGYRQFMFKEDIFKFMEKYPLKFDRLVMYRFLEHVKRTDVLYFIYLMSTSLKIGGMVDCIVPNYKLLAQRILTEDVFSVNFEAEDIIISTELLNEVSSPHASIWTEDRIKKFFELEQRFKVGKIITPFDFDGRSIYLRALIERI
jgi:hypothetical protein